MEKVQEGRFLGPRAWVDGLEDVALVQGPDEEGVEVQLHFCFCF